MAQASTLPRQYDPRDVVMVIGGAQFTDFMEGTMISFSKNADVTIPTVGVLGEVAVALNRDNTGTVTVSLKQTSPSHAMLEAWTTQARAGGSLFFPFIFRDTASQITVNTIGWVQTQPDFALGSEVASLEWVIGLQDMQFESTIGNNTLADVIQSITG